MMKWEKVKIGEISTQIRGVSYNPTDVSAYKTDNNLPILRANNIGKYEATFEEIIFINKQKISDKQLLKKGDILIAASSGSKEIVGKAVFLEHNYNGGFGAFCKVIRPDENVYSKYVGYYFKSNIYRKTISNLSAGANINNLRTADLDNLEIPLPPHSVQKTIAEKLDKADALRKKDQELLKHYDDLAQSVFIDMFGDPVRNEKGWEVESFENACPVKKYNAEIEATDGKFWLLNLDVVESNTGNILEKNMVAENEINASTTKFCELNVLYSKLRPYLNKVVIPYAKGFCTSELLPLLPNEKILNRIFLAHLLRSSFFVSYIQDKVAGAKMPRVNMEMLRSFEIILPPLPLQQEFARIIENIELQKQKVKLQAQESENLFQALLQESFGG